MIFRRPPLPHLITPTPRWLLNPYGYRYDDGGGHVHMTCRGIRGAITVEENTESAIITATKTLLTTIISANSVAEDDIVSIFFSVTEDLNATFPAKAARLLNLNHTPLLCFHEIRVPNGLEKCIRILMHVNSDTPIADIHHAYLEKAANLRPDISTT